MESKRGEKSSESRHTSDKSVMPDSCHMETGKGRTVCSLPSAPSAATDNILETLFSEETELAKDKSQPGSSPEYEGAGLKSPACRKKLEIELNSLSSESKSVIEVTPKFRDLQTFWENRSAETTTKRRKRTGCKPEESTAQKNVISKNRRNCGVNLELPSEVKQSPKEVTEKYREVVTSSVTADDKGQSAGTEPVTPSTVYNYREVETRTPGERMSLKEFRDLNRKCHSDSDLMPPPSGTLSCPSSGRRGQTRTPGPALPAAECSPADLTPTPKQQHPGRRTKRKLLSLSPTNYSQFPVQEQNIRNSPVSSCKQEKTPEGVRKGEVKQPDDTEEEAAAESVDRSTKEQPQLNETSVWSEAESENNDTGGGAESVNAKISIANLSPILPDISEMRDVMSGTLELSERDFSLSSSHGEFTQEKGHVTMAILNQVTDFMGTRNSFAGTLRTGDSPEALSQEEDYEAQRPFNVTSTVPDLFESFVPLKVMGESAAPGIQANQEETAETLRTANARRESASGGLSEIASNLRSPKSLTATSIASLVETRSKLYSILNEDSAAMDKYLSVPLSVKIPGDKDSVIPRVFDPCWSPDLKCYESPSVSPIESQSRVAWSPTLNTQGKTLATDHDELALHDIHTNNQDSEEDIDTIIIEMVGHSTPHVGGKSPSLKRSRDLKIETNTCHDADVDYTPSPKLAKGLSGSSFNYVWDVENGNTGTEQQNIESNQSADRKGEQSGREDQSGLGDGSLEESFRLWIDTSRSSSSSVSHQDSSSTASGVSPNCQEASETSGSVSGRSMSSVYSSGHVSSSSCLDWSDKENIDSHGLSEPWSSPMTPQYQPTYVSYDSVDYDSDPLNLSSVNENESQPDFVNQSDSQPGVGGPYQQEVREISYDPQIGVLASNSSAVWQEVGSKGTYYCEYPSQEASIYAYHTWNNSLTPEAGNYLSINQRPVQISQQYPVGQAGSVVQTEVLNLTTKRVRQTQVLPESLFGSTVSYEVDVAMSQQGSGGSRELACQPASGVEREKISRIENDIPPLALEYQSPSEVVPSDLFAMMTDSVKDRLAQRHRKDHTKAQLSDQLKHVRPYVISGWISSTYLMALLKKTDLVNDLFQDALNEKGEVRDWVVQGCRNNTPAILAKDLVFRLFTLDELKDQDVGRMPRRKMAAIKACLKREFCEKFSQWQWRSKCLPLIKSSVKTLFKHRVRQVQEFYDIHS